MKKVILVILACILSFSLGGCLEEGYDLVQTTASTQSSFAETTINNEVTTSETSTTWSTTKRTTTKAEISTETTEITAVSPVQTVYVLNTNTKKFHHTGCYHTAKIDEENRQDFTGSRQQVIDMGYNPCGTCKP